MICQTPTEVLLFDALQASQEALAAWDHRCDWCDGTIFKGEAVMCIESAAGGWHGRSWRHLDCHSASSKIHPDDYRTRPVTKVFPVTVMVSEILAWANTHGSHLLNDIELSQPEG